MNHLFQAKLPFFPSPCEDELLYSSFARYHHDSGNVSIKATVTDLLGSSTACAVLDLPSRIEQFHSMLSPQTLLTPDLLINNHTLLPLYRPFLPQRRLGKLLHWMQSSDRGGSIHMSAGVMASSVHAPRFLRCCPACLVDDEKSDAEQPYWHRCHQIPGVLICHIHGNWLVETSASTAAAANKHAFYLPPAKDQLFRCKRLGDDRYLDHAIKIANSASWLLKADSNLTPGLRSLQKRYLHYMRQIDLASPSGRIRQKELIERFLSHYGTDFLDLIDCGIDPDSQNNWLSTLVRKPRKATHPLRHLLLIHFLGLTAEQFLSGSTPEYRPFGRGPWPCLNPAAPHYRQSLVTKCISDHTNESGEPVGIFQCECGFSYGRVWKKGDSNDRMHLGWHISFGPLWEGELLRLIHIEGTSLREAAKRLEVDVNTVRFQLQRIEQRSVSMTGIEFSTDSLEAERSRHREHWTATRDQHSTLGRKSLRNLAKADYAWLYRHDRDWLFQNQPDPVVRQSPKERVDWLERDRAIAAKIESAVKELVNSTGTPKRITTTSIGIHLGLRALLEKKLNKLPLTAAKISKVIDSDESFAEKRIVHAIQGLETEEISPVTWRVLRKAAIRDSAMVRQVMNRLLSD